MRARASFLCPALVLASLVLPGGARGGSDEDPAMPPHDIILSGSEKAPVQLDVGLPGVDGLVSYTLHDKSIKIRWHYQVVGLTDSSMLDPTTWTSSQRIALEMWPTDVTVLGPRRIAVAGAEATGHLVVQVLELEEVAGLPALGVDALTGQAVLPELELAVSSRRTVMRQPLEEGRYICALFKNRGREDGLIFQYQDTGELHELNLGTQETNLVAKAEGPVGQGLLLVPQLANRFTSLGDGEHQRLGHLYWFYDRHAQSEGVLVLADSDKDGVLDSSSMVQPWTAEYGDPVNYASTR